jgi:hypothetical protein
MTMTWSQYSRSIPWVATVQTYNNDATIYACLQQVCKQFEHVLVVDDASTDCTMLEVDRFVRREKPSNIHVFNLSHIDPWPDLRAPKREWDLESTAKTQSKAKYKAYQLAKQLCKDMMWVSIESDVIICDNARARMVERVSKWTEPHTDCEFFNLIMTIDPWHVRSVSQSENEYIKPEGIRHRREYDHPGDWGLAVSWLGGNLSIVPDPIYPYGPAFSPWLSKNQTGKKGQDDTAPYGFHLLSYRSSDTSASYCGKRYFRIRDISDSDVDWDLLHRVRFPITMKLDHYGNREVLSCEW